MKYSIQLYYKNRCWCSGAGWARDGSATLSAILNHFGAKVSVNELESGLRCWSKQSFGATLANLWMKYNADEMLSHIDSSVKNAGLISWLAQSNDVVVQYRRYV